ncbi:MAG: hypothetical protein HXY50_02360 [Ignavibacteriaceae bacterium]|nr:hypothetical protein [Ignavibacteriaceae bacterium]
MGSNLSTQNSDSNKQTVGNSLFEFLTVAIKYRWFLICFIFLITLSATLYAVFAPKWYKATASVLPAEQNDLLSMAGLSGLAKGFSATRGLAALTGSGSESDKFIAILKSATITKEVIDKFNLREEYQLENTIYEKVVKEWQSNFELELQDEGNLTITIYDKNPQKAANIANYLVQRLNEKNTELGIRNARANREFIQKRYFQNVSDISSLELEMKKYQQKFGVIALPEQLEATVKSMSEIYTELYKKQIQYNITKQSLGMDHPLTAGSKVEIAELEKKIDQLNAGSDASQQDVKILIPFKEAPELGNEYLKIYRNLEIQYKILEFIQPLYEQAKVEEVRNTPSVLVLDNATPADHKAKPKILLYLLLSFVISTSIAFLIVIILEAFQKLKSNDGYRYQIIVETIKSDLSRINFLKRK